MLPDPNLCKSTMESNVTAIDQIFQKAIVCADQGQEKDSTRKYSHTSFIFLLTVSFLTDTSYFSIGNVLNFMKQVLKPVRAGGVKNLLSDRVMSTQSTDLSM